MKSVVVATVVSIFVVERAVEIIVRGTVESVVCESVVSFNSVWVDDNSFSLFDACVLFRVESLVGALVATVDCSVGLADGDGGYGFVVVKSSLSVEDCCTSFVDGEGKLKDFVED